MPIFFSDPFILSLLLDREPEEEVPAPLTEENTTNGEDASMQHPEKGVLLNNFQDTNLAL
jgi:hypothetical protein